MKKLKITILSLIILTLIASCTEDDPAYPGLGRFNGKYKIHGVYPYDSNICLSDVNSPNDLEIDSNGRFKRKIYTKNANNECVVGEILEGEIEITGSFYERPFGEIRYDNSDIVGRIDIKLSENGIHNELIIHDRIGKPQYFYYRTD
ncbi:hypothetical protein FDT66_11530 [Polaribacter aestuariivivens]|uniref:Lipocalin-like domain-containing protein n=1 Tax=Polaribacter aestuariivivens TaxID=2304626 RepID=A0A5S3N138_9FLAO|nr:hypothetical protein [Polaribacter aestuariivivens]TMM29011.1 hypothetical protein FDT66_11530 [Polaribacter aestuariivivens]